jgi:LacI family transcriptional regulator
MSEHQASASSSLPRVALFVETHGGGRDMLRGIARYVRESGPWSLHHEERTQQFAEGWEPKWLATWKGNGVLGRIETNSMVEAIRRADLPTVHLLGVGRRLPFPQVLPDNEAIGRMAAEHLLERGFRNFGYVGWQHELWSEQRRKAFKHAVTARGFKCEALQIPNFNTLPELWDQFIDQVAKWIRAQPKPLGLMLCYDHIGPPVTQACRQAGVAVPEEVAIVGVDNEEVVCAICDPPLSSVCPNHEEVGYRGAALLDRMMSGAKVPVKPIIVEPRTLVVRQSSSASAIEDSVMSSALQMIREQACNGLQVADIARRISASRSVLQRRFREVLGRNVHSEILRVQIDRAQDLLRTTELSVRTIAEKAGFKHPEYMATVFRSHVGITPAKYRQRHRPQNVAAEDQQ